MIECVPLISFRCGFSGYAGNWVAVLWHYHSGVHVLRLLSAQTCVCTHARTYVHVYVRAYVAACSLEHEPGCLNFVGEVCGVGAFAYARWNTRSC